MLIYFEKIVKSNLIQRCLNLVISVKYWKLFEKNVKSIENRFKNNFRTEP